MREGEPKLRDATGRSGPVPFDGGLKRDGGGSSEGSLFTMGSRGAP
jgi:hypothetical protein